MKQPVVSKAQHFWSPPWQFKQSFAIGFGLLICGFAFQITMGKPTLSIHFPMNIILISCLIIAILFSQILYANSYFSQWIRSIPASIASIANLLLLALIIGIFPQSDNNTQDLFGFQDITNSWTFLFSVLYFLFALGGVTVYRTRSMLFWYDARFILMHLGLWIVVVAGLAAAADLQRLTMYISKKRPEWRAIDKTNRIHELKVAIELRDFVLEEFPPKLVFVKNRDTQIVQDKKFPPVMVQQGLEIAQYQYAIHIDSLLVDAIPSEIGYKSTMMQGATYAVKVTVIHIPTQRIIQGWIAPNNYFFPPKMLILDSNYSIALLEPEPKKFRSDITAYTANGQKIDTILEVNKPFTIDGWKIYQLSYDQPLGKWSDYSVIELVQDPWLPIIYVGMYMMIAGAVLFIWTGYIAKKKKSIT